MSVILMLFLLGPAQAGESTVPATGCLEPAVDVRYAKKKNKPAPACSAELDQTTAPEAIPTDGPVVLDGIISNGFAVPPRARPGIRPPGLERRPRPAR